AHEQFRSGVQLAQQGGFREVAAQLGIDDAEVHAIAGQCSDALSEVAEGLALSRDNFSLETASRVQALCGATRESAALLAELQRRYPDAPLINRVSIPVSTAAAAVRRGEGVRALEMLDPVKPFDYAPWSAFWPAYLRGQAQLGLKRPAEAGAEFQTILDHRG